MIIKIKDFLQAIIQPQQEIFGIELMGVKNKKLLNEALIVSKLLRVFADPIS
jgi:hypothetical protein